MSATCGGARTGGRVSTAQSDVSRREGIRNLLQPLLQSASPSNAAGPEVAFLGLATSPVALRRQLAGRLTGQDCGTIQSVIVGTGT